MPMPGRVTNGGFTSTVEHLAPGTQFQTFGLARTDVTGRRKEVLVPDWHDESHVEHAST